MDKTALVEILSGRTSLTEASYSSGGAANVGQPALWTGRQERLAQNWRDVLVKLEALFLDVLDADENVYGECLPILKDVRTAEGESCWECLPRFRTLLEIISRQVGDHWARYATHMKELVTDMEWMCDQLAPKDDLVPEKPPKEKDDWQADQDADLAGLPKPSKTYKPANESTTERPALPPICPSLVMASLGRASSLTEASSKAVAYCSAGDAIRLAVETYVDADCVEIKTTGEVFKILCEWEDHTATATFTPSDLAWCSTDVHVARAVESLLTETTDPRETWNAARVVPNLYNLIERHRAGEIVPRFRFDETVKSLTTRVGLHESVQLADGELNVQFTESVLTLYGYFWDWEQRYSRPFPGKDTEGSIDEEIVIERWESGHLLVNLEAKTVSIVGTDGDEEVIDKETTDEDVTARLLSISTQRESRTINAAPWASNFRASLTEEWKRDAEIINKWLPGAKAREDREKKQRAAAKFSKIPAQPVWTTVENIKVLYIKGSNFLAVPANGRENSANWDIISLKPRKLVVQLKKAEVRSWLIKSNMDESRGEINPISFQGEAEDDVGTCSQCGNDDEQLLNGTCGDCTKNNAQKAESWERELTASLDEQTDPTFSDTFTGHVAASDKLAEAKPRCRNCGKSTPEGDMRGENCRKCSNEINRPDSVQKKDWTESFRETLDAVEEASQISFNPSNHPRGPDGRFIKGKHASRSQKSAATLAGKKREADRGHKPMTNQELDTAVSVKKGVVKGMKTSTKQDPGKKKAKVVDQDIDSEVDDIEGIEKELAGPDIDSEVDDIEGIEKELAGGAEPAPNVPDPAQNNPAEPPKGVEAPPQATPPVEEPAPAVPPEQAPTPAAQPEVPTPTPAEPPLGVEAPPQATPPASIPQPAAPPPDEYTPKTKPDDPKIKPKPSTSDVSAYEPEVDQEFGQKEKEPTPAKRPEVPDAPGAPVDATAEPPADEQQPGESPQASFVSPDAAPYGDKSIQQAQPPKGFEDIIEPVTPNFVQKYRRPPEDIANTSDEDFVQIRDYIYNQAAQALAGDEADPNTQNILKQSQRDVEDLMNAMREEAKTAGEEFAGLTDDDYEGAVRGKMRDRLEAEVDRMMQQKSDQPAADEEAQVEQDQKKKDMWEKIIGHVGSFAGFTWDLLKDIYARYISGAGYENDQE